MCLSVSSARFWTSRRAHIALRAAALIVVLSSRAVAQAKHHALRGRVTTDSGAVLVGADVIVTIAPTAETVTNRTDSAGRYSVTIPDPTGEYLLYVGAVGRKPVRQRVTITAADSTATIDVKLARVVTQITGVRVQARKARPTPSLAREVGYGASGTDKTYDGVLAALTPDQQGGLDAMATFIPGVTVTPNGVSAFGLASDANSRTLNGLAFGGGDVPRGASVATRFRSSPWDPTLGGFSGVQTSVQLAAGSNITRRRGWATLDAPSLQFSDPVSGRLGQKYTSIAVDEGGSGAFRLDKYFYSFGIHAAHETAPVSTLADLDPAALAASAIAVDSAAQLVRLLRGMDVPMSNGSVPRARTTNTVSYLERFDLAPRPTSSSGIPGSIRALTIYGRYSRADAQTLTPTAMAGVAGTNTSFIGTVQGQYARYFGKDGNYVNQLTSALSLNSSRGRPYAELPSGNVFVASDVGLGSLAFGGNSALETDTRTWTWEAIDQTDFLLKGKPSLPMKVYLESRLDGYTQALPANRLGRFGFSSLADVAANQPASFSRTIDAPNRSGGQWTGSGALGGNWNASKTFTVTGGVRVDANAFTATPAFNPAIASMFGLRTNHAPNTVSLSPRIGFNWRYAPTSGYAWYSNGAATVMRGSTSIRGGIGKFRSNLASTLLADATSNTGFPGAMQQLLCIGAAVPTPDWHAYAADASTVPTACSGGAPSFADTARSVIGLAPGYSAPESWRASIGWTNTNLLNMYLSVDATYSLNLHQPGTVDLNFAGTPHFTLATEGNRPVFVSPSSIVSSTGSLSAVAARTTNAYGRVSERVSDLRGDARQLTVSLIPNMRFGWGVAMFGYTLSDARSQLRGFDLNTAGDPRSVEWAPAAFTPRHQFTFQYSRSWFDGNVGVGLGLRASSGFRYTPLVAGDISGDGLSNDRAFIFDPSVAHDASVANGLRALLATGSGSARECLAAQLGRVAARNSCVGPWFTTMNGDIDLYRIPGMSNRVHATINFANVPGALDELLHGNRRHGWGAVPLPDATLYQVRGFDQATRAFVYEVNQRFGASGPATTTRRNPFRIALDVQFDLGRSVQEQETEQNMRVRPSLYGTRASADTIKARYMDSEFADIYRVILRYADSLALSRDQAEQLQAEQTVLRAKADSIFGRLAAELATLPESYSVKEAASRVKAATDSVWNAVYGERDFLKRTLTRGQIVLLPVAIRQMIVMPDYKGRFYF